MNNGWSKYVDESNVACAARGSAECLILACNERALTTGATGMYERLRHADNDIFCNEFDNALDRLIVRFGRFVAGSFVLYTTTSIYIEMEETRLDSRAASYKSNPRYYKLWFEQVIRVLNKLILCMVNANLSTVAVDGVLPHGKQSTGYQTGEFTVEATNFYDAINEAWDQAYTEFNANIANFDSTQSNFDYQASCFTPDAIHWWAKTSLIMNCCVFNYLSGKLMNPGQKIIAKWTLNARGRTRKPLTAELLGFPVTQISDNYYATTYECYAEYTADSSGNILLLPPWGTFDFPLRLAVDSADGFAETELGGDSYTFYGGNFVFVHGS